MAIPWQDFLIAGDNLQDLSDYVEDEDRIKPKTNWMKPIGPSIWLIKQVDPTDEPVPTNPPASATSLAWSMASSVLPSSSMTMMSWKAAQSTGNNNRQQQAVIVGLQGGGGAWIWNPQAIKLTDELKVEIQARCGGVRHLVTPNKYRIDRQRLLEWSMAYPKAKLYAPPDYEDDDGLTHDDLEEDTGFNPAPLAKAPDADASPANDKEDDAATTPNLPTLIFDYVLTDDPFRFYVEDMDQVIFKGSATDEVVFFHRLSKTVLFGDLIQQRPPNDTTTGTSMLSSSSSISASSSWWNVPQQLFEAVAPLPQDAPPPSPQEQATTGTSNSAAAVTTANNNNNNNHHHDEYFTPYTWQLSFWWKGEQELARKALNTILNKWRPQQIVLSQGDLVQGGEEEEQFAIQVIEHAFAWVPPAEMYSYETHLPVLKEALGGFQRGTFSTGGEGEREPPAEVQATEQQQTS
jgi:hypothetical protein